MPDSKFDYGPSFGHSMGLSQREEIELVVEERPSGEACGAIPPKKVTQPSRQVPPVWDDEDSKWLDATRTIQAASDADVKAKKRASAYHDEEKKIKRGSVGHPRENRKKVKRFFLCLVFIMVVLHYDNGALPAVLEFIGEEYNLNYFDLGILGALVYWGLTSGILYGFLFRRCRCSQKRLLLLALFLNAASCVLLAYSMDWMTLYAARFASGITKAPLMVYIPTWIREFAPVNKQGIYNAILSASVVVGVIIGYLTAGLVISENPSWSWSSCMLIQAGLLIVALLWLLCTAGKYVDNPWTSPGTKQVRALIRGGGVSRSTPEPGKTDKLGSEQAHNKRSGEMDRVVADASGDSDSKSGAKDQDSLQSTPRSSDKKVCFAERDKPPARDSGSTFEGPPRKREEPGCVLLRTPAYICVVVAITAICFVFSGMNFWMAPYLMVNFGLQKRDALITFAANAVSAPILGVFTTFCVVDRMGSFEGGSDLLLKRRRKLLLTLLGLCFAMVACAVSALFIDVFSGFAALSWAVFFFGGGILPLLQGLVFMVCSWDLRTTAGAAMQIFSLMFGFSLGIILPGAIIEGVIPGFGGDIKSGMTVILSWTGFAVLGLFAAFLFTLCQARRRKFKQWAGGYNAKNSGFGNESFAGGALRRVDSLR